MSTLIATASTDTQRKRTTDLFRLFARRAVKEAYLQGQNSMRPAPAKTVRTAAAPALPPDHLVSLIPLVNWQG